jgi:hypothetical protein
MKAKRKGLTTTNGTYFFVICGTQSVSVNQNMMANVKTSTLTLGIVVFMIAAILYK